MNLRQLNLQETGLVYKQHLLEDFPQAEVKPFARIEEMWEQGIYMAYGLFESEELIGYAFFVKPLNGKLLLLDYLAVCRGKRCGGTGSKFLHSLKQIRSDYDGIILEVENPDFEKDEEKKSLMIRRIGFYERNGFKIAAVVSCLFKVEYKIMTCPFEQCTITNEYEELNQIYKEMFPGKMYERNVSIFKSDCI